MTLEHFFYRNILHNYCPIFEIFSDEWYLISIVLAIPFWALAFTENKLALASGTYLTFFKKTLKIIIPSKIRYVHHHHTHVLVMKDKKPYRGPDAKYHHLHFYDPNGRKGRDTNHYFIPYIPPQAEDEADEETADNYAITAPKKGSYFHADNYRSLSTKQLPPIYEPEFYSPSKKYRLYSRADVPLNEILPNHPISSLKQDDSEGAMMKVENEDDHEYSREFNRSYDLGRTDSYETEPLLYPRKGFYSNKRIRYGF